MNKKITRILFYIFIVISALHSETDDVKKEPVFPGYYSLYFLQRIDWDDYDNKAIANEAGTGYPIYSGTELFAEIGFPIKFYTISFWAKDLLEFNVEPQIKGEILKIRNRFYTGINNSIYIENILGFSVDLYNEVSTYIKQTSGTLDVPTILRPSTLVRFWGDYKFGLKWNINQEFIFTLKPALFDTILFFDEFDIEGEYGLSYEFFHFFAPKNVKCFATIKQILEFNCMGFSSYSTIPYGYWRIYGETYAGINFDLFGISPYAGLLVALPSRQIEPVANKSLARFGGSPDVSLGFATGVDFKINWFSLSFLYQGFANITDSTPWENEVVASMKIQLDYNKK